ncbi:hypothetical protein FORC065_2377 [Yersinia enterocolitica]|nr:hypothetical protein FORC065_2377 [Yersinia enterocolitica]
MHHLLQNRLSRFLFRAKSAVIMPSLTPYDHTFSRRAMLL